MTDISISQVTTTDLMGDGVFDVLMRSIDGHLDKQFLSGRIKGADYATVYLGALQAVLQQSIAFILAEQKTEKEVDLLGQQLLTEIQQTRLVDTNADAKEYEVSFILPEGVIKLQEEIDLLQSQDIEIIASTTRQNNIANEQITASIAATALKQQLGNAQTALYTRQTTGFNDDYQFKVFKALMDMRTTGMTQEMAGLINGANLGANQLANEMLTKSGLTGITNIIADVV